MLMAMKNLGIKTSFKLIPAFLVLTVGGTLIGACLYMLYSACTQLVAGETISAFSRVLFSKGVCAALPVCASLSGVFLVLYLIRHPQLPFFPVTFYSALMVLVWLVILPACHQFTNTHHNNLVDDTQKRVLSPGFFRKDGPLVLYYSQVYHDNSADGLCIDSTDSDGKLFTFTSIPLAERDDVFSDSLIEETVAMPKLFALMLAGDVILNKKASASYALGFGYWLCFATLGLALLSVIGLRRVTSWRLLNTFLVIFSTAGILAFNALYYGTGVLDKAVSLVNGWFVKLTFIHDPFIVLCNVVTAAVFLLCGLLLDLFKKNSDLDEEGNPV